MKIEIFWEGGKREALNRVRRRNSVNSHVGLCELGATMSRL